MYFIRIYKYMYMNMCIFSNWCYQHQAKPLLEALLPQVPCTNHCSRNTFGFTSKVDPMAQAMATSHPGLTEPSPATEEMGDWITTAHRNVFISHSQIYKKLHSACAIDMRHPSMISRRLGFPGYLSPHWLPCFAGGTIAILHDCQT